MRPAEFGRAFCAKCSDEVSFSKFQSESVPIEKIKQLHNIRTDAGDMTELMESIRQIGLMQPIGLWDNGSECRVVWGNRRLNALRKLGYKTLTVGKECVFIKRAAMDERQYLILNATENLQRKEITPVELGKLALQLKETFDMNVEDVAREMGVGAGKIYAAIDLYKKVPAGWQSSVGYVHGNTDKDGMIAGAVMKKALNIPLRKLDKQKLFTAIKQYAITESQLGTIRTMVESGSTIENAVKPCL